MHTTSGAQEALLIGGEWRQPQSASRTSVVKPATEEVIGEVPDANGVDVAAAVCWPPDERSTIGVEATCPSPSEPRYSSEASRFCTDRRDRPQRSEVRRTQTGAAAVVKGTGRRGGVDRTLDRPLQHGDRQDLTGPRDGMLRHLQSRT
jgi:hypothetical protein